jgi:hypothetical protein
MCIILAFKCEQHIIAVHVILLALANVFLFQALKSEQIKRTLIKCWTQNFAHTINLIFERKKDNTILKWDSFPPYCTHLTF